MSFSPQDEELRAFLDPIFNGLLVESFASGIYTLVFIQAIWKLYWKGDRRIYLSALCISWICAMVDLYVGWVSNRHAFVISNDTPVDMFLGVAPAQGLTIAQVVAGVGTLTCSDGILIWRCHVMWHNRFMSTIFVLLLLLSNAFMIWNGFIFGPQALLLYTLGTLASTLVTLATTFMISMRIILSTRQNRMQYSYGQIINILVQSAFLVSIINLVTSVGQLVAYVHPFSLSTRSGRAGVAVTTYLSSVQSIAMGIAPTLIAFRVVEEVSQQGISAQIQNRGSPFSGILSKRSSEGLMPKGSRSGDPAMSVRLRTDDTGSVPERTEPRRMR